MAAPPLIDVIIPVYRGVEETRRCVDSVLAAPQSTPFDIILIDDCSPDDEIRGYLADLSSLGRASLIRNERNLGFVASVNRGMSLHPDRDVLLLNSDTEVANDWLDRLRRRAHARPDIGTVTPFSNNATICSYPYEGWPGGVPGTLGLAALDRLFATINAGKSLEIPTAVGFCMYIRRDCLDAVGPFDEDRFGRGYGEENDFCMRAAEAGWHSLLAGDVFVYHKGGVSFSGERHALQEAAMAALLERHPDYLDRVHDFIRRDPAAGLRLAVDRARLAAGSQEAAAVILERGAQPDSSPRKAGDGAGPEPTTVVAVVVTHHPRPEALSELLAALCPQVEALVLVDNGSGPDLAAWIADHAPAGVLPIFLDDNRGVAAAQNAGIRKARELGADCVLLSDQDSLPAPDMVARLLAALRAKESEGLRVAAVGPRYEDARDGAPGPFVRLAGLRYRHQFCAGENDILETDHLISSGCLIPASALDAVGEMTEDLFIDHVDAEWGLRAKQAGYRSFGACAARMRHARGERPLRFAGRTIPIHEPIRYYYQTRNTVWLIRRPWLPPRWKLAHALRLLRNALVYSLLPGPRLERCRMMALGLRHGLRDRMGRLS